MIQVKKITDGGRDWEIREGDLAGEPFFQETKSGVSMGPGGVFNVHLGKFTPLTPSVFSSDNRFLSIQVGTDAEMIPRQRLVSVGYALQADTLKPGATIQGGLSVTAGIRVGESSILIGMTGAGAANTITFTSPPGPAVGTIRTTAGSAIPLTINAGGTGALTLNPTSSGGITIGNAATTGITLASTTTVQGNLTVQGRLVGDGSGLTGVASTVADPATLGTVQTFTGAKTFSAPTTFTNNIIANTAGITTSLSTTTIFGNLNVQGRLTGDGSGLTGGGNVIVLTNSASDSIIVTSETFTELPSPQLIFTLPTQTICYFTWTINIEDLRLGSFSGATSLWIDDVGNESQDNQIGLALGPELAGTSGRLGYTAHYVITLGAGTHEASIRVRLRRITGLAVGIKHRRLTMLGFPQ